MFDAPHDTSQNGYIEGLPFGTRGGMLIEHEFPADGELHVFTVKGMTGYFTARARQRARRAARGHRRRRARVPVRLGQRDRHRTKATAAASPEIPIKAGFHRVGVTFIATSDLPDTGLNTSFVRTMNSPGSISGYTFYPHVGQVFIEGPFNGAVATSTQSRDKIFECYPESEQQQGRSECARKIIATLAGKAFRRPATEADVDTMMAFFDAGREEGGSFDYGIEAALQRILADPEFIYRSEIEPAARRAGHRRTASATWSSRRACRSSSGAAFPMRSWSSSPSQDRLHDPKVLEQQVARMIADPRSEAFIENFTGQWLNVRGMKASEPVVDLFPDFDSTLREAFRREIELFFGSVIQEDRSVLDLLTADYTFVNERLAKHYGIPDIYGSQFRRVTLGAGARHAPRPARQGRAVDDHVGRRAHVAGQARQVVPRDVPRRQPAATRRPASRPI